MLAQQILITESIKCHNSNNEVHRQKSLENIKFSHEFVRFFLFSRRSHTDENPEKATLRMGNFLQNSDLLLKIRIFFSNRQIIRRRENKIAHSERKNPNLEENDKL